MPSSYSNNLGFELPAASEQVGTWGTTVNTNIGTLIEQAISGYVTQAITDGADTSVTIPNGSTGVARNMFLELTGTLTNNRNLIVPANKKLYFIYNNTSGGFSVTVRVSGQPGVGVPNNKKMLLVCNGTDVVEAVNYMTTLSNVSGPGSSTDNAITRFDGTTGKLIQNSSVTIDDSGNVSGLSFAGIGTSLTALNATNLSSGTVADARLSSNIPLLNTSSQSFTGLIKYGPSGGTAYELGFRDIPIVAASSNGMLLTSTYRNKCVDSAGFATLVVPSNAEDSMAAGATIGVYNNSSSTMTISINGGNTLRLAGSGSSGTRTLAQRSFATLYKVASTEWLCMGAGVT